MQTFFLHNVDSFLQNGFSYKTTSDYSLTKVSEQTVFASDFGGWGNPPSIITTAGSYVEKWAKENGYEDNLVLK